MNVLLNVFRPPEGEIHEAEHDDATTIQGRRPQTPAPESTKEAVKSPPYGVVFQVPLNDSTLKSNRQQLKGKDYSGDDDNTTVSTMPDLSMQGDLSVARSVPALRWGLSRKRSNSVDSALERSHRSLPTNTTTALHHQLEQSLDLESSSPHQLVGMPSGETISTSGISLSSWLHREQEWRTDGGGSAFRPLSPYSFASPSLIFSPPSPNTPSLAAPIPNLPVARLNFKLEEDYNNKSQWHSSRTQENRPPSLDNLNARLASLQKHYHLASERKETNREKIEDLQDQRAKLQQQTEDLQRSSQQQQQHPPTEIITSSSSKATPVKGRSLKGRVPNAGALQEELDLAKRRIQLLEYAWTDVTNAESTIDMDQWAEDFHKLPDVRPRTLSDPSGSLTPKIQPPTSLPAAPLSPEEHQWMKDRLQESVQQLHSLREQLAHLQTTAASTGVLRAKNQHLQEALLDCQQRISDLESQVLRTKHAALDNEANLQQKLANYHRKVQVAKKEMGKAKAWMTSVVEDLETAQATKSELEDALCDANASNEILREQLDDLLAHQYNVGSNQHSIKKTKKRGRLIFSGVDPEGIEDDDEFEVEVGSDDEFDEEESQSEDEARKIAEETLYRRSKHILHQLEEERIKVHLAERETWRITKASEEWQTEAMRRREENEALELAKIQMEQENAKTQSSLQTDVQNLTRFNADLKQQVDELRTEQEKYEKNEETLRRDFELRLKAEEERFANVEEEFSRAQDEIKRLDAANQKLISQEQEWKASLEEYRAAVNKLEAEKTFLENNLKSSGTLNLEDLQNSGLRAEVEYLRIKLQESEDNFVYHQREWKVSIEASREAFRKLELTNKRLVEESAAAYEKSETSQATEGILKEEIQSLESRNSSLQIQVQNLRAKFRESERLFSVYEEQLQESLAKSQSATVEEANESRMSPSGQPTKDISGKGVETDGKITAQEHLYKLFLEESKDAVSKLQDEKAMLEEEIVAIRDNNGAVQKTQASLRDTLLDLQTSRAQLAGQVENLWTKQGERELKFLAQELELKAALEKSLQAFRRLEFEKAVFEGQVKDLRGKNILLQSTQDSLRQDLKELTTSNNKLCEQMGSLHTISEESELRFSAEKKDWTEEREDLNGTIRRLMEEKTLLEEDIMILDEENEELDATREALQADIKRLTESKRALQEQVVELKDDRRDSERKYLSREQDLRISVERSRSEVHRLESVRATLEERMAEVTTSKMKLQSDHESLLQGYKRLTASNATLQEQVEKLRGKLDRRERDLLDRRKEWKALLDESKDALKETREDRGFLKEEVLRLKAENAALGTDQSSLQQDLEEARGLNADLQGKVEEAEMKVQETEKKLLEQQTSWTASLEESLEKITQLESTKATSSNQSLQEQIDDLQSKLKEKELASQQAEEEYWCQRSEEEKRYTELEGEHSKTQSDLKTLATANAHLKSKERDLMSSLEEAYQAMGKLEVESAHFKDQMMISRRVEADLEEENEKLKKEIADLRASKEALKENAKDALERKKRKNAAKCIQDLNTILGGVFLLQLDRDEAHEGLEYESEFPEEDDCRGALVDTE